MRRIIAITVAALLLLVPGGALAAPGASGDADSLRQLAAARRATAAYHDIQAAVDAGYVPVGDCVGVPDLGSMGVHHANFGLFDTSVDELAPEGLLYDHGSGGPRLVAVEYVAVYVGQPAPTLFGRPMDGPMAGHEPGMPTHYDLHAWLWQANPEGIFAEFNPNLSC